MAQGAGVKKCSDKFNAALTKGKSKGPKRSKPLGPKKGGGYIAPKKAKLIAADKRKKAVSKQIDRGIEQAFHQQALSEGNEFRVLPNDPGPAPSTSKAKHK